MLPKRKSRPIIVGGNRFRYSISCSWKEAGWFNFNITIQSEPHNGAKLLAKGLVTRDFWLDFPDPENDPGAYPTITPRHIENFIKRATSEGWRFEISGKDHVLILNNETEFEAITQPRS